ncbi:hypothetical protein PoB_004819200 [Plakobranchus ocellatus]|uniref:Uncharacterized protein n=1 Tax=Plakobranchus ocellatus TaxID=259542 RepID=A0AAV4BQS0_9GAST|nr:hypothetical protein PoB_004819200 [Plakobranchus ocellatus]
MTEKPISVALTFVPAPRQTDHYWRITIILDKMQHTDHLSWSVTRGRWSGWVARVEVKPPFNPICMMHANHELQPSTSDPRVLMIAIASLFAVVDDLRFRSHLTPLSPPVLVSPPKRKQKATGSGDRVRTVYPLNED